MLLHDFAYYVTISLIDKYYWRNTMGSARPVQIKIEEEILSKAKVFAEHEGFRSVASMAHYAFVQFLNSLEEKKIKSFEPTIEEKEIFKRGEDEIRKGNTTKLDLKKFSKLFE